MYDNLLLHFEPTTHWPFAKALDDSQDTYRVYFFIMPFFASFLLFALKEAIRMRKGGSKVDLVVERPSLLNFLRYRVAFGLSVTDLLLCVMTFAYSIILVWARMKRSMGRGAKKLDFLFQDLDDPIKRGSWEWIEILAKTLGVLAIVLLGWFVLMPMGRKSILLEVMHVPREIAIKYHRWLGWYTLWVGVSHVILYTSVWIHGNGSPIYDPDGNMLKQMMVPRSCKNGACDADTTTIHLQNMFGYAVLFAMMFMAVTSLNYVRRHYYDFFFYSHQMYWLLTVFLCFHYHDTLIYLIPGIAIILVDKTIGFVSIYFAVKAEATVVSPDWFEVKVRKAKSFRCEAGQYVFINVPLVSVLEWHPMTVTWETEHEMALHIKSQGGESWSQRVMEEVHACAGHLPVRLDGFYGSNQVLTGALDDKDAVVFFCGGIGLTFPISILMELCILNPTLPVYLNWVTRTKEEYAAFEQLLLAAEKRFSNLSVAVWITLREESSKDIEENCDKRTNDVSGRHPYTCYGSASIPKSLSVRNKEEIVVAEEEVRDAGVDSTTSIATDDTDNDDIDADVVAPTTVWLGHRSWMCSASNHAIVNAMALIFAVTGLALARMNQGEENLNMEARYLLGSSFVEYILVIVMVMAFVVLVVGVRLGRHYWPKPKSDKKRNMTKKTTAPAPTTDPEGQIDPTSAILRCVVGMRPDIAAVLESIQNELSGKKNSDSSTPASDTAIGNIAVSACGPQAMVDMVKDECQKRVYANWSMYEEEWEW
jgi:predicted ferric reductase